MEILGHVPANCGYNYVDENGTDMIEHHVDSSYHFQDKLSATAGRFGGTLALEHQLVLSLLSMLAKMKLFQTVPFLAQDVGRTEWPTSSITKGQRIWNHDFSICVKRACHHSRN